jgi:hypothetical protein
LMEMVMSHNQAYLEQFQNDLRQQRFAMIVSDPQNDHLYDRDHNFVDENNLWVMEVARPILCYYKPADPADVELDVTMYIPSSQACK